MNMNVIEPRRNFDIFTDASHHHKDKENINIWGFAIFEHGNLLHTVMGAYIKPASIYELEIMAVRKAMEYLDMTGDYFDKVNFYIDNINAIKALNRVRTSDYKSKTYLKGLKQMNLAHIAYNKLLVNRKTKSIRYHKVKAHSGVTGNELIDQFCQRYRKLLISKGLGQIDNEDLIKKIEHGKTYSSS